MKETYALLARIGEALDAVHQEDLVHGNLKTQNIVFNAQHEALLADFLLFPAAVSHSSTKHHAIVTLGYDTSQLDTNKGKPSKESDLYAFGLITYELFTGQRPFRIDSKSEPNKIYKVRALIPPRQLNPALTPSIEQALLQALAKDPKQRYNNVRTFLTALGVTSDLATQNIYESRSTDIEMPIPFSGKGVELFASREIIQPQPVLATQEKTIDTPSQQVGLDKTKEELLARALTNRSRPTSKKLFLVIVLLMLPLFGTLDLIYNFISQGQQPTTKIQGQATRKIVSHTATITPLAIMPTPSPTLPLQPAW